MNPTRILTIAGALLMASVIAAPASAFQVRGGARTSVNNGNWQNAHETNVATRQENRTTRESNRQNTVQQVSNNRTNAAENISNNRTNAVNNYNDNHGGWYNDHPVATAAAVTGAVVATAAVVGSIVHSLPPSCSAMSVNGVTYQQCGSTWYQPQYAGTSVQYVVVNPPR
ncbi:conserved exported hypothetical protein [Paraburkholderia unamae]|uniref:hypothetical protein n=1 Tax=Paraburkholderia unamae TaxID=219649 RepID=UPI001CB3AA40|nr:hypothetical protein [Paraburkholderia unamae]CAG9244373.1 conserved exported hypothetical protein [Paraburkholderia unamae]